MFSIPPQNAAQTSISVTGTATALFTLVNTAGSTTQAEAYYVSPPQVANVVSLRPEDGDIRVLFGATPTSAVGFLVKKGTRQYFHGDVNTLKLIRTGGSSVTTECLFYRAQVGEVQNGLANEVTATLSAGATIDIGNVQTLAANTTTEGTQACDTTAGGTQVVAANATRAATEFTNQGAVTAYFGTGTVTSSYQTILPGQTKFWNSQEALKVLSSAGSVNITYIDYTNS